MHRILYSIPFAGLLIACSSTQTSTKGQLITCTTDPGTGVILRCLPGGGDGSGSNTCTDVDEDGDGDPHDTTIARHDHGGSGGSDDGSGHDADDDDDDGIPNGDDCDDHPGEDEDGGGGLPYDVRPALGATTAPIHDAFAAGGGQPASIVSVTMDGGTWRLAEMQAGTPFVVSQDDCDHAGNRDTGRDRVVVTWTLADGSSHSDHLDIRYCKQ